MFAVHLNAADLLKLITFASDLVLIERGGGGGAWERNKVGNSRIKFFLLFFLLAND